MRKKIFLLPFLFLVALLVLTVNAHADYCQVDLYRDNSWNHDIGTYTTTGYGVTSSYQDFDDNSVSSVNRRGGGTYCWYIMFDGSGETGVRIGAVDRDIGSLSSSPWNFDDHATSITFGWGAIGTYCAISGGGIYVSSQDKCCDAIDTGSIYGPHDKSMGAEHIYSESGGSSNKLCYNGATHNCDPLNLNDLGKTYGTNGKYVCTVAGWKNNPDAATCTVGTITGVTKGTKADGTPKSCCTDPDGLFDSSTIGATCYLSHPANADKFGRACALVSRGDPSLGSTDIFIGTDNPTTIENRCAGNNVLPNGDFEDSVRGWDSTTLSDSTSKAISGSHSGFIQRDFITPGKTVTNSTSDTIIIRNNNTARTVTFSGWVYVDVDTSNPSLDPITGAAITLYWGNTSSFKQSGQATVSTVKKNQWVFLQGTLPVPAGMNYLKVALFNNHLTNGLSKFDAYFDEVRITGSGLDYGAASDDGSSISSVADSKQYYRWFNAVDSAFKIKATSTNNIISNGNEWFVCDPNSPSAVSANHFNGTDLPEYVPPTGPETTTTIPLSTSEITTTTTLSGDISTSFVDQDDFLKRITQIQLPSTEVSSSYTSPSGTTISITASPNTLDYSVSQKIALKISGLKPTQLITDTSVYNITVSNKGSFLITSHPEVSVGVDGKIGYSAPFEVRLPLGLEKGSHDLNITVLNSCPLPGICNPDASYLFKDAFTVTNDPVLPSFNPLQVNPERFLCTKEGGIKTETIGSIYGSVLECCGPDYRYCMNSNRPADFKNTRISGGPTGLLKDFYSSLSKNGVALVGCPDSVTECRFLMPFDAADEQFPISDWSSYDALEFDVLFVGSDQLNIQIREDFDTPTKVYFDDFIARYSTSGSELNKWHHIRIPLTPDMKTKNPKRIKIYASTNDIKNSLADPNKRLTVTNPAGTYIMIIGLDRFFLSSGNTKYCATDFNKFSGDVSNVGRWITDLDTDRDACNNVPSYHWTSANSNYDDGLQTHCCGDDQNALIDESYKDVKGGCWKGQFISNNTIVPTSVNP